MLSVSFLDGNVLFRNITGSFNTYRSNEDAQILDWLLETGESREWRGSENGADKAVLFCSGNPVVGKTYLI